MFSENEYKNTKAQLFYANTKWFNNGRNLQSYLYCYIC